MEAEGGQRSVRADGERERPRALVPVGALEDARLALEPAAVRLLDVLAARREDVEDEATAFGSSRARAARSARSFSSSVSMCRSERNGQMTSGTRSVTGGSRRSPSRRSTRSRDSGLLRRARARRRASPGDESTPITSIPGAGDRDGDAAGPDRELDHGAARRERLVDVEADVLGDRAAPRVVEGRDLVVEPHHAGLRATQTNSRLCVVEGPLVEPAVERLRLEAGDVDQAEPLVPRRPPERARVARVERDVDAARRRRRMRCVCGIGSSCRSPSKRAAMRVVEGEGVPGEAATRAERGGDALEDASPIGPRREVEQRAGRAVDERRAAPRGRARACPGAARSSELAARVARAAASIAGEESMPMTVRPVARRNRDRDAAGSDRELDDRARPPPARARRRTGRPPSCRPPSGRSRRRTLPGSSSGQVTSCNKRRSSASERCPRRM